MRNTTVSKIVRILAKLICHSVEDMINDGFLPALDARPINVYRCAFFTRITGRRWLAPLYRPQLGTFSIKAGVFVAIREHRLTVDIEYVDATTKESVVYTVKAQEWREKRGYFLLIPPNRITGSLGETVRIIKQLRKGSEEHGNKTRRLSG